MYIITRHKSFTKDYKLLPRFIQEKFKNRLYLFQQNSSHPLLNRHRLSGKYTGFESINITGDYRALFRVVGNTIEFCYIGTHSQLYKN